MSGGSKCPVTRGTSRPTIYRHFIESAREESATASPPRDNDNEPAGCRGSCRDRCSDGRRRRCRQKSRPSHIGDQRQRQCYRRRVDSDIETALRRERLCFFLVFAMKGRIVKGIEDTVFPICAPWTQIFPKTNIADICILLRVYGYAYLS